jgi:molybdopterin-guanine dinucleotide biosynthesis protein
MIERPNAIIIGAAWSNSGKTTFACGLISRFVRFAPVAIKITTIDDSGDHCPSGKNCGVCTSIGDNFIITRERDPDGNKDTNKMLSAGAAKVFWLRARASCLEAGVRELLDGLDDGACIVLESNSARTIVEPGLFLVTKDRTNGRIKPSCKKVIGFADRTITFDDFEATLGTIRFTNMKWTLDN